MTPNGKGWLISSSTKQGMRKSTPSINTPKSPASLNNASAIRSSGTVETRPNTGETGQENSLSSPSSKEGQTMTFQKPKEELYVQQKSPIIIISYYALENILLKNCKNYECWTYVGLCVSCFSAALTEPSSSFLGMEPGVIKVLFIIGAIISFVRLGINLYYLFIEGKRNIPEVIIQKVKEEANQNSVGDSEK